MVISAATPGNAVANRVSIASAPPMRRSVATYMIFWATKSRLSLKANMQLRLELGNRFGLRCQQGPGPPLRKIARTVEYHCAAGGMNRIDHLIRFANTPSMTCSRAPPGTSDAGRSTRPILAPALAPSLQHQYRPQRILPVPVASQMLPPGSAHRFDPHESVRPQLRRREQAFRPLPQPAAQP